MALTPSFLSRRPWDESYWVMCLPSRNTRPYILDMFSGETGFDEYCFHLDSCGFFINGVGNITFRHFHWWKTLIVHIFHLSCHRIQTEEQIIVPGENINNDVNEFLSDRVYTCIHLKVKTADIYFPTLSNNFFLIDFWLFPKEQRQTGLWCLDSKCE